MQNATMASISCCTRRDNFKSEISDKTQDYQRTMNQTSKTKEYAKATKTKATAKKKRKLPVWLSGTNEEKRVWKKERDDRYRLEMDERQRIEDEKQNKWFASYQKELEQHPRYYTVVSLKDHCRSRGLKVSDRKAELVERLVQWEKVNDYVHW